MEKARNKLLILLVATIAYRASSNMLQTSVPLYAQYTLHAGDFLVSVIAAVSTLASLISLSYFGFRYAGVGKGILISMIMLTISIPLLLLAYNLVLLTIVYAFISLWTGSLSMLLLTAVSLISDAHERQDYIAIFTAMLSLSLFLGPIYQAGILAFTQNSLIDSMISFAPLTALATILFFTLRFDNDLKAAGKFEIGFTRSATFWTGVAVSESFTIPFILVVTFGGIFAKDHFNVGYSEIQTLFGIFFFVSFATRFFLIRKGKTKTNLLILFSFVAIFSGLSVMYLSANISEFIIGFVLLGYSHGISYPIGSTYVAKAVPKEKLVEANSVFTFIDSLDFLIATPIIGILAESSGLTMTTLLLEIPIIVIFIGYLSLSRKAIER